jgi:hypothetical protein
MTFASLGLMKRREFLFAGIMGASLQRDPALQVEVMEVFSAANGPAALLVHHADEATRDAFAQWLRAHSGVQAVCTLPDGRRVSGRIFRVSFCFGRGLILLREPAAIRAKDILGIS